MAANDTMQSQALETVNPADLVIHSNENAIMSVLDDNAWCASEQDINWQQAPIYVGDQTQELPPPPLPPLPTDDPGLEELLFTGDLSYSSYGSSPAENSLGVSRLARQFRQQNLVSPTGKFKRPSISRNISSVSNESPEKMPTPAGRQMKSRRGRLFTDMSYDGPETVFEDSDSHHSWTAADNLEDWCAHLRERLLDFRRRRERVSIITSSLQTRQRRKLHSMANLWGLSHMSLGSGREKRMLLSKCELVKAPPGQASTTKRWNPTMNNWSPGLVDPRIVLIDNISSNLNADRLWECLRDIGLSIPQRLTIDYPTVSTTGRQNAAVAFAMYGDADDTIAALLALDGTRPDWNGIDAELEADYVQFPPGFVLSEDVLNVFHTLPETLRTEKLRLNQPSKRQRDVHAQLSSDSETDTETYSAAGATSQASRTNPRKASTESSSVRDSGYMSGGSAIHSDYGSETSTCKKRKRVPKIAGGYACKECGKVFDRDGDRRKHEKNHNPKRNHLCEECGKAFLFPKDLRRHMVVHSTRTEDGIEPSSVESTNGFGTFDVTQPIPVPSCHLHSRTRPMDRRVSRLSSSLG